MKTEYMVTKETKVNGKRQTWALYSRTTKTAYARVPKTLTYYKASDAICAAYQQFDFGGSFRKHTGRGSAYWTNVGATSE